MKLTGFAILFVLYKMSLNKRNVVSIQTKIKILDKFKSGKTRKEICKEFQIAESTLSKIIKNSEALMTKKFSGKNLNIKKNRKSQYDVLNKTMSKWFAQMAEKNTIITGPIILEKAEQFAIQLGIDFKPNSGWLHRWKKQENIRFRNIHGEASSGDVEAADLFKENVLPDKLTEYELDEIYNADETGLMYKAISNKTYAPANKNVRGQKVPKNRLTLLFICNATGSDKLLFSIGKSKNPRCFRGKHIPVPYKFNTKAWMTSILWCEIMRELDEMFAKKNKKILLLIDNASCHKLNFTPENIEVLFLPPNTTSLIQPLDQGNLFLVSII